jgi:hypothetical protein
MVGLHLGTSPTMRKWVGSSNHGCATLCMSNTPCDLHIDWEAALLHHAGRGSAIAPPCRLSCQRPSKMTAFGFAHLLPSATVE